MTDGMDFEVNGRQIRTPEAQLLLSMSRMYAECAELHALASSLAILAWCHECHPESHTLDLNLTIMRKWVMLERHLSTDKGRLSTDEDLEKIMDRVRQGGEVLTMVQQQEQIQAEIDEALEG